MGKNIFITAPFGYSIKNLLYSTFWQSENIKSAASIIILTPTPEIFNEFFVKQKINNAKAISSEKLSNNILRDFIYHLRVKKYLRKIDSKTDQIRRKNLKSTKKAAYILQTFQYWLAAILPFCLLDYLIFLFYPMSSIDSHKFNVWLSLAPSFDVEIPIAKNLQTNKQLKKIALIHSWDNLSSKGPIIIRFDQILTWGDWMKEEVIKFLDYPSKNVTVVGMPQYDSFFEYKSNSTKAKKQILYSTGHPSTIPHEKMILELIASHLLKNLPDYKIIIRVHPNDNVEKYLDLKTKYPNVEAIENPGQRTAKNHDKWAPNLNDMQHYADILQNSSVVLNIASTVTLDASYFGTPVINIAFDEQPKPLATSIKRYYQYNHFSKLLTTQSTILCQNIDQLIPSIRQVAKTTHKDSIQQMMNHYDPFMDGHAGKRIGDLL